MAEILRQEENKNKQTGGETKTNGRSTLSKNNFNQLENEKVVIFFVSFPGQSLSVSGQLVSAADCRVEWSSQPFLLASIGSASCRPQ